MPSAAPTTADVTAASLLALGEQLRAQRKRLGVSATTAAEAAGMSRVTLHRIERGEPSVTIGAYFNAAAALGLGLGVIDAAADKAPRKPEASTPALALALVRLADYPQLQRLAWQYQGAGEVTPAEALSLYERNWRHIDQRVLTPHERTLIEQLVASGGGSRLLV